MKIIATGRAEVIGGNFVHYIINKYNAYKISYMDDLNRHLIEIRGQRNE